MYEYRKQCHHCELWNDADKPVCVSCGGDEFSNTQLLDFEDDEPEDRD